MNERPKIDGNVYFTSDTQVAAYFCHKGFTLLGAVQYGSQDRLDFPLTWPVDIDEEDFKEKVISTRDEFPNSEPASYIKKYRMCLRALRYPQKVESIRR